MKFKHTKYKRKNIKVRQVGIKQKSNTLINNSCHVYCVYVFANASTHALGRAAQTIHLIHLVDVTC